MYSTDVVYWRTAAALARTTPDPDPDQELFGFLGDDPGRYEDVDWRSTSISKPTEAECRAAWEAYVPVENARLATIVNQRTTMSDFAGAAATLQAQLDDLIAANAADITALAADGTIPAAAKVYLRNIMQRQAQAIQAQIGAFRVAIVLARRYADIVQSQAAPQ